MFGKTQESVQAVAAKAGVTAEVASRVLTAAEPLLREFFTAGTETLKTADELMEELKGAVKTLPEQFQPVAHALLGLIDHYLRVGTQASLTLQEYRKLAEEVRTGGLGVLIPPGGGNSRTGVGRTAGRRAVARAPIGGDRC